MTVPGADGGGSGGRDEGGSRGREDRDAGDRERPTSLVPRWLAWVVLLALLASASFSVWSLLRSAPKP